jgi:hypothetical protein
MINYEWVLKAIQAGKLEITDHARQGMVDEGIEPYRFEALIPYANADRIEYQEAAHTERLNVSFTANGKRYFMVFAREKAKFIKRGNTVRMIATDKVFVITFSHFNPEFYANRVKETKQRQYVWESKEDFAPPVRQQEQTPPTPKKPWRYPTSS